MASILTVKSSSTRCTIKEPPSSPEGHPALSYNALHWLSIGLAYKQMDYLSDRDVQKLSCL